jgi:hypothetical protein
MRQACLDACLGVLLPILRDEETGSSSPDMGVAGFGGLREVQALLGGRTVAGRLPDRSQQHPDGPVAGMTADDVVENLLVIGVFPGPAVRVRQ